MEELSLSSTPPFASTGPGVVPLSLGGAGESAPHALERLCGADANEMNSDSTSHKGQKRTRPSPNYVEDGEKRPLSQYAQGVFRNLDALSKQLDITGRTRGRNETTASESVPMPPDELTTRVKPYHISPIEKREYEERLRRDGTSMPQCGSDVPADHADNSSALLPPRRDAALSTRRHLTPPPPISTAIPPAPLSPSAALPNLSPARTPQREPESPQKGRGSQPKSGSAKAAAVPPSPTTRTRDGRIKVVVRKRPFVAGEPGSDCVSVSSPHVTLEVTKQRVDLSKYTQRSEYTFDDSFGTDDHNQAVYTSCALELLDVALSGGSASCFAYGQTGSGKTHTMMGNEEEKGLYLLAAADLFHRVTPSHRLEVSFYEIYCNSLFDLLNDRAPVVLREGSDRRINVCGLGWHRVTSPDELWGIISAGMEQRKTGSTSANEQSSRSHAVLSIRITNTDDPDLQGIINFVDLAGSERAADTANNEKQTRLEGAEINKSLLALKECIRALDERKKHVPFRGSRLTEVLRDSFTGNSKTVMIANISPSSVNFEHTSNTLRYAFRVKGLSVASVAPDKARNAPRPYVPPARSRGRTQEISGVTPPRDSSGPMPERQPSLKRYAHSASPLQDRNTHPHSHDLVKCGSGKDASGLRGAALEDSYCNTPDIRLRPFPLRGNLTPASAGNSFSGADPAGTNTSRRSAFSDGDREELEERIRRNVVRKVQRDLGREIQCILDQRDSIIAQLRQENAELRQTIDNMKAERASIPPALLSTVPFQQHRDITPTLKPSEAFVVRSSVAPLESSEI